MPFPAQKPLPSTQGGGRYHQSYRYDADGGVTRTEKDGKEVTLYSYDEESRLLQVSDPLGQITRYTYDGDGKRVSLTEAKGKTIFIYDGSEVLAEANATGTIKIAYTRMPGGRLVSQWQGGETFWYHLDGLGSTMALTDESGTVRNKYGYDEYGNLLGGGTEQVFNRFTFTGLAWDASVGLYHYKARYYNPAVGRFLTQDTWKGSVWTPWTQNLYSYVGNNPVNMVDPTGHRPDLPPGWFPQSISFNDFSRAWGTFDSDWESLTGVTLSKTIDDLSMGLVPAGPAFFDDLLMATRATFRWVAALVKSGQIVETASAVTRAAPVIDDIIRS